MKKQIKQSIQKKQVLQQQIVNPSELMITGQKNQLSIQQQKVGDSQQQGKKSINSSKLISKNKIKKNSTVQQKTSSQNDNQLKLEINNTKNQLSTKKSNDQSKSKVDQKTTLNQQKDNTDKKIIAIGNNNSNNNNANNAANNGKGTNNQKKEETKQEKNAVEAQPISESKKQQEEEKKAVEGKITINYSHYKEVFKILNGTLSTKEIDERFFFSGVFQGNYKIHLKLEKTKAEVQHDGQNMFNGLENEAIYTCYVEEDEEAEKQVQKKQLELKDANQQDNLNSNKKIDNITSELKKMSEQELREKGDKYKELIEARDIEDILYK